MGVQGRVGCTEYRRVFRVGVEYSGVYRVRVQSTVGVQSTGGCTGWGYRVQWGTG